MPFYGTVYGTGNVMLSGNAAQGLEVNAAMTTNRNTTFTYINGSVASATSNQFIKFVDKTPRRTIQDSVQIISYYDQIQQNVKQRQKNKNGYPVEYFGGCNSRCHYADYYGPGCRRLYQWKRNGNIRTEFYNKGDVKMFGNYRINQGSV